MNTQDVFFSICNGINSVSSFLFGLFVLSKNPKSKLYQIWFWMSLAVATWGGFHAIFFAPITQPPQTKLMIVRLANAGAVFIPLFYLHFIVTFLQLQTEKRLLTVCYFLTSILAASAGTPLFIPRIKSQMGLSNYPEGGPLFLCFFALYMFEAAWGNWLLWKARKNSEGARRTQITYIFAATTFGFVVGGTSFLLTFNIAFPPIGMCFVWLYNLLLAWAVFKHQLFDIQVVIRKSLVYSLLVTSLTAGYFGLIYAIEQAFRISFGYHSIWLSLIAFGLMTLLFQPLKIGIQRLVDWIIFRVPQEQIAKRMERLEEHALQAEKLKAISTLAAGMAHEIKNPLTAIKTFTEFIPERHQDPVFAQKLHAILSSETKHIQQIIQELLEFAKPKPPQLKSVEIGLLLNSTVGFLSSDLLKHHIQWTISCRHNGVTLQADPDQLRQILINLIQNAADAMPTGGTLTLATQANNGHLELTVTDTGEGIPKELLPKIFDPFITTKATGTGLGLAMVHTLVRAHHGSISATSIPTRGTTFTLRFPL